MLRQPIERVLTTSLLFRYLMDRKETLASVAMYGNVQPMAVARAFRKHPVYRDKYLRFALRRHDSAKITVNNLHDMASPPYHVGFTLQQIVELTGIPSHEVYARIKEYATSADGKSYLMQFTSLTPIREW